jgi:hypothetical protein
VIPAWARRRAMPPPIAPSPINPIAACSSDIQLSGQSVFLFVIAAKH